MSEVDPSAAPGSTRWWRPPQLHDEEEHGVHRKVTWLELFYDLVYVVAIAEIAHGLAAHPSAAELGHFLLLFTAVWWVWMGGTFYTERFESRGVEGRVFFFLMMLGVAGLALFAGEAVGKDANRFALSFLFARVLIYLLWMRGMWWNPAFRPVGRIYAIGLAIGILCWVASLAVAGDAKYALWIAGLAIECGTPAFTLHHQAHLPRYSSSKLPERFGLFTIIVLGEFVAGSIQGLVEARRKGLDFEHVLNGVQGIAIAFGLWWIYFDFIGRRPPLPGRWRTYIWGYAHLPLWLGLTASGACIRALIEEQARTGATHGTELLVGGALALALGTMAFMEPLLQRADYEPTQRRVSPALKLGSALAVLGIARLPLPGPAVMSLWLLVLGVNALYGAWRWFRTPAAHAHYQG